MVLTKISRMPFSRLLTNGPCETVLFGGLASLRSVLNGRPLRNGRGALSRLGFPVSLKARGAPSPYAGAGSTVASRFKLSSHPIR